MLIILAAVSVGIVAAARGFGGSGDAPSASLPIRATAVVARATLTQTKLANGTLSYGRTTKVVARAALAPQAADSGASSSGPGAITWLAPEGAVVHRGETVYRVNDWPVVLLAGETPLYRYLAAGAVGPDVTLLEANLAAFGYDGFTVDDRYTSATVAAVVRWQQDLGIAATGTVDVNQVVVAATPFRVAQHTATPGDPAAGEVLQYSATERTATVQIDVADRHLFTVAMPARLTLPDGRAVDGTVASIGTVASPATQSSPATVALVVALPDQQALSTFDLAPVQLSFVVRERKNVLTVPVAALVALAEGGYGVEVAETDTTRFVAVTTGMFGNGKVEITSTTIGEGTAVVVPS